MLRSAPAVVAGVAGLRRLVLAALALVLVTAVWGSTFALSKDLLHRMSVTGYLALRFLTAVAVAGCSRPRMLVRRMDRRTLLLGAGLGVCYFLGPALRFFGLQHTPATVSAFVVSMYVIFTPLLDAALVRSRPDRLAVLATVLATAGVATMSLRGWALGYGELLTLVAALLYGGHILALSRWSTDRTAYSLTFAQLSTLGVCASWRVRRSTACTFPDAPTSFPSSTSPSWRAVSRCSCRRGRRRTWPPDGQRC